jgi:hypothetical protein
MEDLTHDEQGLLRDEQGSRSMARTMLVAHFVNTWVWIWGAAFTWWTINDIVAGIVVAIFVGLIAWAGGARIAQYVAPQLGAVVAGVTGRLRGVDRSRKDDESG